MQPTSGGGGGGGGGSELSRGGLARFRSAPATWLEALLESEEEDVIDPPKPLSYPLTPPGLATRTPSSSSAASYVDPLLLSSAASPSGISNFLRQNSSPAEFLTQISSASDGYFSNFGIPSNYDYLSSSPLHVSTSGKLSRDLDLDDPPSKFPRGEQGGLLDAEMEKISEDSVPCRVRAKRGCATHPRSIAERVRRTRISDRIRKLQELVPNMDKQTNTADMLEEAVEYVKFLQKQIQELTDHQKNCKCSVKD